MKSLDEIRKIKAEVEPELLQKPGVTGVDVGYKQVNGQPTETLAIRIYVERKHDVAAADRLPSEIQGVPTDVIERRFILH